MGIHHRWRINSPVYNRCPSKMAPTMLHAPNRVRAYAYIGLARTCCIHLDPLGTRGSTRSSTNHVSDMNDFHAFSSFQFQLDRRPLETMTDPRNLDGPSPFFSARQTLRSGSVYKFSPINRRLIANRRIDPSSTNFRRAAENLRDEARWHKDRCTDRFRNTFGSR